MLQMGLKLREINCFGDIFFHLSMGRMVHCARGRGEGIEKEIDGKFEG
jgi:hypothetical protein